MKASLLLENLQKKIILVSHGVSVRSQLPILLNFLIEAKDGRLVISATDLEIGISASIPAKVEKAGSLTVPAKTFTELVGAMSSGKINLEKTQEGLSVTGEKGEAVLQTSPADEFPKLYEEIGEKTMVLEKKTLDRDFLKIAFAASLDSERPALSGILIKEEREGFLLVATDGYRLSLKKQALRNVKKTQIREGISLIIPARVIRELVQMGKDDGGEDVGVYVSKEKNQIVFSQNDIVLVGRLIEAEFPNYEKIIPTDFSTKTIFEREALQKAVKVGYIFARQTAGIIKMSIQKNRVVVSANAPSVGKNKIEIEAKTTGEENEIAFNARYLLDFLSNTAGEMASFEMTGPLNPGVFKEVDDSFFMHLIMPIRVQQEG